ncbi:pilin, partial [Frankia sp. Cj3]|uniref:pilin n=1 Tax=Frankia sp. Cj3 TaxID=2880976 RepID=UPI001EF5AC1D
MLTRRRVFRTVLARRPRGLAARWRRRVRRTVAAWAGVAGAVTAVVVLTVVTVGIHRSVPAVGPSAVRLAVVAVLFGAVVAVTEQTWRSPPSRPAGGRGDRRTAGRALWLTTAVLLALMICAGVAWADPLHLALDAPQPPPAPAPEPTSPDLDTVIKNLRNWLIGIIATVATLFFTVGGMRYLGANGDPSEVERAKQAFKNAAIGYGLAILAPLFLKALKSVVG